MKNRYVLLIDIPLIVIAALGAFALRFDWRFFDLRPEVPRFVIAALLIKPVVFLAYGMYRRLWRYASVYELGVMLMAVTTSSICMGLLILVATFQDMLPNGFSRVVLFSDWLLTLVAVGGFRLAIRLLHEANVAPPLLSRGASRQRLLVIGAGAAGQMVAREVRRNPQLGLDAVGFLDDDANKIGKQIGGIRVFGQVRQLADVVRTHRVDSVVIAIPTARGPVVRSIVDMCNEVKVKSQTVPGVFELLDGNVSVNRLRNVAIEDLLGRAPVDGRVHTAGFLAGRVVMVTGGGGSIGFELSRQIAITAPSELVLLGHGENSIFEAEAQLRAAFPTLRISTVIADIRDERRLAMAFDRIRPSAVFHAAAHKHVPLMEENPEEAVTNNVIGTRNVVQEALRVGTERLVLISTDKAVSPSSVMGATKRIAEAIVRQAAMESGRAFVAVRFGNVLGSRGSVVHTFKRQIERGGPITVTHPEMTRFFMTIPEAVHLVLEASARGKGGELFVLDMGEPVKILELAEDLIKLSGLSGDDIPIVFSGMRPGEKLEEILFDTGMQTAATSHPDVLQVMGADPCIGDQLQDVVFQLREAAARGDRAGIVAILARTIPGFALNRNPAPLAPDVLPAPADTRRVH